MSKAIDYFSYDNPLLKVKTFFSCRARRKMYQRFEEFMHPTQNDEVLDLGVTPDVTLEDSNFFEKYYPYKNKLTIASVEDCDFLKETYGLKEFVRNQSKEALPFKDKQFDILFCSAVLEHVGSRADQKFFLQECMRVADRIYLTTPNRYFPVEMHTFLLFLHWLPWRWFQKIVRKFVRGGAFWADTNNLNLLCKKDIEKMFTDKCLSVSFIKTFGWNSNLVIVKAEGMKRK